MPNVQLEAEESILEVQLYFAQVVLDDVLNAEQDFAEEFVIFDGTCTESGAWDIWECGKGLNVEIQINKIIYVYSEYTMRVM